MRLLLNILVGVDLLASAWTAGAQTQQHVRLMPQVGVTGEVNSVAFSPDGRFVLTGSFKNTAQLWDVSTGSQLRSFADPANKDDASSVAFSPDRRLVFTGGMGRAFLWDIWTGRRICPLGYAGSAAFSKDGRLLLTGSYTAQLWDVGSGKIIRKFGVKLGWRGPVGLSSDGRFVLTGGDDNVVRIWDAATGQQIRAFAEQPDYRNSHRIESIALSKDGRFVLTGIEDGTTRLWDFATGQLTRVFPGDHAVISAVFSPDGHFALTVYSDGNAVLWDVATGQTIRSFERQKGGVTSAAFSPSGKSVLMGTQQEGVILFDLPSMQKIRTFTGHAEGFAKITFSPDGHYLAVTSSSTKLWDTSSGQLASIFRGAKPKDSAEASGQEIFSFSADGRLVLTSGPDNVALLWDVATGKEVRSFVGHKDSVLAGAFSLDGSRVLTGSNDNSVKLWSVATGELILSLNGHTRPVGSVAFSPDGRYVLTGSYDNTARLWNSSDGRQIRFFGEVRPDPEADAQGLIEFEKLVDSVSFSRDGRLVLTNGSFNTSGLWDASSGEQILSFESHLDQRQTTSLAFSPDGRTVLTGRHDGTSRLWDIATGNLIRSFEGHTFAVWSAVFSPDGRFVATTSGDMTTRLWDAVTGKQLATLLTFDNGGWAVVDPEGRYDASDPSDASGLVWVTDNLRPIGLGQLKHEYYTPGLLARVMKGERLPDVTGMDTVSLPPVVSVDGGYSAAANTLNVSVTNDGGGVGRLLVQVNGRLLRAVNKPGTASEGKSFTLPIDLSDAPFVEGDNTVRVTAYDAGNRIESYETVAHYTMPSQAKGFKTETHTNGALSAGKFYAVLVGTSAFGGHEVPNLTFPAKDAESFATGLRIGAERLYGRDKVWMRVLTSDYKAGESMGVDGLPTKANIRAAFDEVRKNARPEDTLVVYLSGHGAMSSTSRDLYYYLTMDARTFDIERNPALKDVSTVSSAELFEWLREPVKTMPLKQVVILDTCAAGAAGTELMKLAERREVPPDQRRAIELLKDATGTYILMGSAADKASYEASKYGEGLLTYALLNGMRDGQLLTDGTRLDVGAWFARASKEVPNLAKTIGGIQEPVIAAPKGRDFPVAMLTAEDRAKIPQAVAKPQLLRVACLDDALKDKLQLRTPLREQLRALTYVGATGSGAAEPPVLYLDGTDDNLAGALLPQVRYSVAGGKVTAHVLLITADADEKTVAEEQVTAQTSDPVELAKVLAGKIVEMAGKVDR